MIQDNSDIQSPKIQIRQRVCDTAEPWEIREKLIITGWESNKMFCGDYWFMTYDFKRFGITRKTTEDLLQSIFMSDNKAQQFGKHSFKMQLEEMLDRYDMRKILIEGSWRRIFGDDITRKHVWNFLNAWQDKGFTLDITTDTEMTIKRLNELYAKYQEPYSLVANTKGFTDDRILAFPSGCRGKTAKDALEIFGSISSIGVAIERLCPECKTNCIRRPEEFCKVPKVGPKKAESIYEHFNKKVAGISELVEQRELKNEQMDLDEQKGEAILEQEQEQGKLL